MSVVLNIVPRTPGGKKLARKLRHEGFIPGIIYGAGNTPISVSIGTKELCQICYHSAFFSHIIETKINNKTEKILPRDIDFDPVTDKPVHVDFQRITDNTKIKVNIAIEFIHEDKSPGIKKGGVLNIVTHQLECYCYSSNIPEKISLDMSGKEIGDNFKLADIKLVEGVTPVHADRDAIIATIVGAKIASEKEEVSEETAGENQAA